MNQNHTSIKVTIISGIIALTLSAAPFALAKGGGMDGGRGSMQGPPQEAVDACEGKSAGDNVTFTGRRGESLSATCETVNDQLVAVPEGHRSRQQQPND